MRGHALCALQMLFPRLESLPPHPRSVVLSPERPTLSLPERAAFSAMFLGTVPYESTYTGYYFYYLFCFVSSTD